MCTTLYRICLQFLVLVDGNLLYSTVNIPKSGDGCHPPSGLALVLDDFVRVRAFIMLATASSLVVCHSSHHTATGLDGKDPRPRRARFFQIFALA